MNYELVGRCKENSNPAEISVVMMRRINVNRIQNMLAAFAASPNRNKNTLAAFAASPNGNKNILAAFAASPNRIKTRLRHLPQVQTG